MLNIIALWNAIYTHAFVEILQGGRHVIDMAGLVGISPLVHRHLNFLGRCAFTLPEAASHGGELRHLREPDSEQDFCDALCW